jgi:hypothetical protein
MPDPWTWLYSLRAKADSDPEIAQMVDLQPIPAEEKVPSPPLPSSTGELGVYDPTTSEQRQEPVPSSTVPQGTEDKSGFIDTSILTDWAQNVPSYFVKEDEEQEIVESIDYGTIYDPNKDEFIKTTDVPGHIPASSMIGEGTEWEQPDVPEGSIHIPGTSEVVELPDLSVDNVMAELEAWAKQHSSIGRLLEDLDVDVAIPVPEPAGGWKKYVRALVKGMGAQQPNPIKIVWDWIKADVKGESVPMSDIIMNHVGGQYAGTLAVMKELDPEAYQQQIDMINESWGAKTLSDVVIVVEQALVTGGMAAAGKKVLIEAIKKAPKVIPWVVAYLIGNKALRDQTKQQAEDQARLLAELEELRRSLSTTQQGESADEAWDINQGDGSTEPPDSGAPEEPKPEPTEETEPPEDVDETKTTPEDIDETTDETTSTDVLMSVLADNAGLRQEILDTALLVSRLQSDLRSQSDFIDQLLRQGGENAIDDQSMAQPIVNRFGFGGGAGKFSGPPEIVGARKRKRNGRVEYECPSGYVYDPRRGVCTLEKTQDPMNVLRRS